MNFWIVDSFADKPFMGNPAVVVMLDQWIDSALMQNIAMEMNLSGTAFIVKVDSLHYDVRFFTPKIEVALCGHATLAAAHVLWSTQTLPKTLYFHAKSGILRVCLEEKQTLALDLEALIVESLSTPVGLVEALGKTPIFVGHSRQSCFVELDSPSDVIALNPDFSWLSSLPFDKVVVTANGFRSDTFDLISRCFAPKKGIIEDPVTGSSHAQLGPYWSRRLRKNRLKAYQASKRGGLVDIECINDRVILRGKASIFAKGDFLDCVQEERISSQKVVR